MRKKIYSFSCAIVACAIAITVVGTKVSNGQNIVTADLDTYAAGESTTSLMGFVSDKVDGFGSGAGDIVGDISDVAGDLGNIGGDLFGGLGGIGDSLSGIGDALGGVLGGLGNNGGGSTAPQTTQSNTYAVNKETVGYINPVPFASEINTAAATKDDAETEEELNIKETVDYSATQNPYKKPTGELKGGDKGDAVKWMQWVFIYTRYGLKDDGITGVFDEDTVSVVKKLQKEKGLEVDGIVDSEVIAQIELLYFEAMYGATSINPSMATPTDTTIVGDSNAVPQTNEGEDTVNTSVILVIALVLIWVIAIALIVILFVVKKKKNKKKNTEENPNTEATSVINEGNENNKPENEQ